MGDGDRRLPARSGRGEIDAFLGKVAATPARSVAGGGRLLFAMDATASREPTWSRACELQVRMFAEAERLGGLQIQLCHYGGLDGFGASPWLSSAERLGEYMRGVRCREGLTQIARVLRHARDEARREPVRALVFVGDCVEENVDVLAGLAGELGLLGVPAFLFQEGGDPAAKRALRTVARLSGGHYCAFDAGSARQLAELLRAVAVYAAGGRGALEDFARREGGLARRLTHRRD